MTDLPDLPENIAAIASRLESDAADLSAKVRQAIGAAYLLGRKNGIEIGRAEMRDAVLKAAQAAISISAADQAIVMDKPVSMTVRPGNVVVTRASRGAVRDTIVQALTARPGLTEKELAHVMEQINPTVSGRSAGGELRRLKGRLYRQVGSQWFLMGDSPLISGFFDHKETAEPVSSAVPQPTAQEEPDAPATIAA